jgi:septum formation topological specificity factor MinE
MINKANWRLQVISKKKNDLAAKNETTKDLNQEIINIINDLAELENKSMQLKQKLQATKQDLYHLERQINLDKKDLKSLENEVQNNVDERR